MDEIEAVASLRSRPTGPSSTAVAEARARLDREIRPGGARRRSLIGGADWPRFAWGRRLAWAGAMSLAVVAGLVAVAIRGGSGPDDQQLVAVTQLLDTAAKGAAAKPFTAPRDDQFAYRDLIVVDTDASGDHREQDRSWQSVGSPADVTTCTRKPPAAFDCVQPAHNSVPPQQKGGADLNSYAYLKSLPRDPSKLLAALRGTIPAGSPDPASVTLADLLTDLLASPLAPPDLRAATVKAIAKVDGVRTEKSVTDAAGRTGTAVAWTNDGLRYELIFKADFSEYLGYRMVLTEAGRYADLAGVAAGTVVRSEALLTGGIVDRARQTP